MNKNTLFNFVLALAVIILFILNFNKQDKVKSVKPVDKDLVSDVDSVNDELNQVIDLTDDTTLTEDSKEIKIAGSRVGYFVLEELIASSPFLNRKTQEVINQEKNLYESAKNKEDELISYQSRKQKELEELDRKSMLSQTMVESAQRELMEKQQKMQLDLQNSEKQLTIKKQEFVSERDKIIFDAVKELNKKLDLDYVLIDNLELRLVVPLNERNNITKELAKVINKKYKK